MSSEDLTDEQRTRIQRNKEKALALLRQKQTSPQKLRSSIAQRFTAVRESPASTSNGPAVYSAVSNAVTPTKMDSGSKSMYFSKDRIGTDKDSVHIPLVTNPKIPAKCVLKVGHRFDVVCAYHKEAISIFRNVQGSTYMPASKTWSFPLSSYRDLEKKMKRLNTISFEGLPQHVQVIFANYLSGQTSPQKDFDLSLVDEKLLTRLFPFQLECINFAISRGGRVLIADDMGLGKTVEALGILSYYRHEFPALIVCPASLRYTWKHAITEWLSFMKEDEIVVIDSNNNADQLTRPSMRITIVGYSSDLLKTGSKYFPKVEKKFKDESHFIKNADSKRALACGMLTRTAKRVILLSGTPALSRPKELFTQIKAVSPYMFRTFNQFGLRYCDPKKLKVKHFKQPIIDYSGASNMEELEALLRETIMIRRVKEDVLHQLPAKVRGIVLLDSNLVNIEDEKASRARNKMQNQMLKGTERHSAMLEFYAVTSVAKLKAVADYVLQLLEQGKKFLLFAHHKAMMDHLGCCIAESGFEAVRIDGVTPAAERKDLCDRFQTEEAVRVALLSITATGTGLTLTAANLVVFAELFWNPGILAQAEDRAHRVGQSDCVHVQYLVAQGTADDFIWPLIQKKLDILNKGGLSKGAFKTSETTRLESSHQPSITDFMESLCNEDLGIEGDLDQDDIASPSKKPRID